MDAFDDDCRNVLWYSKAHNENKIKANSNYDAKNVFELNLIYLRQSTCLAIKNMRCMHEQSKTSFSSAKLPNAFYDAPVNFY